MPPSFNKLIGALFTWQFFILQTNLTLLINRDPSGSSDFSLSKAVLSGYRVSFIDEVSCRWSHWKFKLYYLVLKMLH